MKPIFIVLISLGGLLLTAGAVLLGIGIGTGFFSGGKTINNQYEIVENFASVDVKLSVSSVTFDKSSDDKCHVETTEKERIKHSVIVNEGALTIRLEDNLHFYEKMFAYTNLKIKIFLPQKEYENLNINLTTGNLKINGGLTFKNTTINMTTGNISLNNMTVTNNFDIKSTTGNLSFNLVNCDSLKLVVTTGNISFTGFVASKHLNIQSTTGDITFKDSDANTIDIETTTGNVKGNLLSDKTFDAKSNTGRVNVPDTTGPICKVRTSTGDIILTIKAKN